MASTFTLKARDTRPLLEVQLLNPDGSVHDLTGSTGWKLHVSRVMNDDVAITIMTRDMVVTGVPTLGVLRYTWLATDWTAADKLPMPVSPFAIPLILYMEYEVVGSGTSRMSFPNGEYDVLEIRGDIGQQA